MNKVIYNIKYQPSKLATKMSDIMSKLDLGIDELVWDNDFVITTKTKITKKYVEGLRKALWKALEVAEAKPFEITYKEHYEVL